MNILRPRRLNLLGYLGLLSLAALLGGCPSIEEPAENLQDEQQTGQDLPPIAVDLAVAIEGQGIVEQTHDGPSTTFRAFPATGWLFSEWFGTHSSTRNPTSILVSDSTLMGARFAPDEDGDGIADDDDPCVSRITIDSDGDGVPDPCDVCPNDPNDDVDDDEVCDSEDICPGSDDRIDVDGDGTPDGCDDCPHDAGKTTAGLCGCGAAEGDMLRERYRLRRRKCVHDRLLRPRQRMYPSQFLVR